MRTTAAFGLFWNGSRRSRCAKDSRAPWPFFGTISRIICEPTTTWGIPVILPANPAANYLAHQSEIDRAIRRVLDGGTYILGEEVGAFEQEFARYLGVRHAVGVGSGTDALHIALRACGVGPGDTVLTVSHTAVATVAAVELTGATAVLTDIDPATATMDVNSLAEAIQKQHSGR